MSTYKFEDILSWKLQQVKKYTRLIALKNTYFNKHITKILEFIEKNNIDGVKLIWLISDPYEPLLLTGGNYSVANKLKNLDPILWKGLRWKQFLEPIILLSEGKPGSTISLNEEVGIILSIIEDKSMENDQIDRLYSSKQYSYEV